MFARRYRSPGSSAGHPWPTPSKAECRGCKHRAPTVTLITGFEPDSSGAH